MKTGNITIAEVNMRHMKSFMETGFPREPYKIVEYDDFYVASFTSKGKRFSEPILFNKKGAIPIPRSFAEIPASKCKNPKVIFESGGPKNVKK